jgi:hypothetical protein
MKTPGVSNAKPAADAPADFVVQHAGLRPSFLYLASAHELRELREALARGSLPLDLQTKLARLEGGDLIQRYLAHHCRLFGALLLAAQKGAFKDARPEQCERLLRVLAYVRKTDDAVPDYRPDGFLDDQQEVRAALEQLHPLVNSFKSWRLRHQVPAMWAGKPGGNASPTAQLAA